jgi:hypothetical protein
MDSQNDSCGSRSPYTPDKAVLKLGEPAVIIPQYTASVQ